MALLFSQLTYKTRPIKWDETLHFVSDAEKISQLISAVKQEEVGEFILCPDYAGRTALHTVPTIETAMKILEHFPFKDKKALLWSRDIFAQSPLHYARNKEVAEFFIDHVQEDKYIMHPSWFMRTALHEVREIGVAKALIENLSLAKRTEFILNPDWNGETAVDLAIKRRKDDIMLFLIGHLDIDLQQKYIQNRQDLEGSTEEYEDTYEGTENDKELCLLFPDINMSNLMKSGGLSGNNTLLYVVACQNVKIAVSILEPCSREEIHAIVTHENKYGINCLRVAELPRSQLYSQFHQALDGNLWSGFVDLFKSFSTSDTVNEKMVKVLRQMSNLHILTDPGAVIEYSMSTKVLKKRKIGEASIQPYPETSPLVS